MKNFNELKDIIVSQMVAKGRTNQEIIKATGAETELELYLLVEQFGDIVWPAF